MSEKLVAKTARLLFTLHGLQMSAINSWLKIKVTEWWQLIEDAKYDPFKREQERNVFLWCFNEKLCTVRCYIVNCVLWEDISQYIAKLMMLVTQSRSGKVSNKFHNSLTDGTTVVKSLIVMFYNSLIVGTTVGHSSLVHCQMAPQSVIVLLKQA